MKDRKKLKRLEKYSRALFLFGQCYSVGQVAFELNISYKEAKKLQDFYLYSQQYSEETKKEMTEFYKKELARKEIVERIIYNIKKNFGLNNEEISVFVGQVRDCFPNQDILEIFFYNCFGKCFMRWGKKQWEQSPFWINFQSRYYCKQDSFFCYSN